MTAILKVDTIQDTAGNNIINESSNTITIGASGDTTNIIGTLQNNGSALNFATVNGITMADQWRLTADKSNVDNGTVFDSNLERVDTSGQGTIGTAMSESSGIFTFPSTGIYWVQAVITYKKDAGRRYVGVNIQSTTNNSSYSEITQNYSLINPPDGNDAYANVTSNTYIDVTDTSNVKIKFNGLTPATITAQGNTTQNTTTFTFIRLGDT